MALPPLGSLSNDLRIYCWLQQGPSAKGEITSLIELGARTADGSLDIVEVRFAGVLEDCTTIDADVVCERQKAF